MKTYYVTYYPEDHIPTEFGFTFNSQFAAIYKARMIRDAYGYATDVMVAGTGEIIAWFNPDGHSFIADDIDAEARKIAALNIPN